MSSSLPIPSSKLASRRLFLTRRSSGLHRRHKLVLAPLFDELLVWRRRVVAPRNLFNRSAKHRLDLVLRRITHVLERRHVEFTPVWCSDLVHVGQTRPRIMTDKTTRLVLVPAAAVEVPDGSLEVLLDLVVPGGFDVGLRVDGGDVGCLHAHQNLEGKVYLLFFELCGKEGLSVS